MFRLLVCRRHSTTSGIETEDESFCQVSKMALQEEKDVQRAPHIITAMIRITKRHVITTLSRRRLMADR